MKIGKIISIISNQYTVLVDGKMVIANPMGKMRLKKSLVVGDKVECEYLEDRLVIQNVLERENELKRPKIANIDLALLLISTVKPDFSSLYTDRLLFSVLLNHIHPILVFTKMDCVGENHPVYEAIQDYRNSGYEVYCVDKTNDLTQLKTRLKGKIAVLCGNSGVGKSTLMNRLNQSLDIKTQNVSKALNRGKHTTTYTTLHPLGDGFVADTPGFSSLSFEGVSPLTLQSVIPDFKDQDLCKFRDCLHQKEPHCQIRKAVELKQISSVRYQNYLKVLNEIKEGKNDSA